MKKLISITLVSLVLVASSTCFANAKIVNRTTNESIELTCSNHCKNIQFNYSDSDGNLEALGQVETESFLKSVKAKSIPAHKYFEKTRYNFVEYNWGLEGLFFLPTWGVIILAAETIFAIPTGIIDLFDGKNNNIYNYIDDSWEEHNITEVNQKEFTQFLMFINSYTNSLK